MTKYIAITLALFGFVGCAGADDDLEAVELGQTQEAWHFGCLPSANNYYGVDNSNVNWFSPRCNINSSTAECFYSGIVEHTQLPYIALYDGWNSLERAELNTPAQAAATFMTGQFSCLGLGTEFIFSQNKPDASHPSTIALNNGTISGFVNPNNDGQFLSSFMHFACTSASPITESYPMSSAVMCSHWQATVDYEKLRTWALASGGGPTYFSNAMNNLIRKTYALGLALGTQNISNSDGVTYNQIFRNKLQGTWQLTGSGEVAWVCNASASERSSALTCN